MLADGLSSAPLDAHSQLSGHQQWGVTSAQSSQYFLSGLSDTQFLIIICSSYSEYYYPCGQENCNRHFTSLRELHLHRCRRHRMPRNTLGRRIPQVDSIVRLDSQGGVDENWHGPQGHLEVSGHRAGVHSDVAPGVPGQLEASVADASFLEAFQSLVLQTPSLPSRPALLSPDDSFTASESSPSTESPVTDVFPVSAFEQVTSTIVSAKYYEEVGELDLVFSSSKLEIPQYTFEDASQSTLAECAGTCWDDAGVFHHYPLHEGRYRDLTNGFHKNDEVQRLESITAWRRQVADASTLQVMQLD